jgi:hypothetical protein
MKNFRQILILFIVILGAGAVLFAQTSDYFLQYPGGFTETFYQIKTSDLENPITLSWRIETTESDILHVTTTNEVIADRQELELGVLNGIAQAQLIIQDESVRALLENRSSLTPNSQFIVPGGARFTTASEELYLGVEMICGVLQSDEEPERRTILGITVDPTLPFPPLMQLDEIRTEVGLSDQAQFCTSLEPLLSSSGVQFMTKFRLELTSFERSE